MPPRDTADVLDKARGVYNMAQLGLSDLLGPDPRRRTPGFWNAVTFGRNVSFVLQGLKHSPEIGEAAWEAWYAPRREAMQADPLLNYMNKLRSVIEKEGGPNTGTSVFISDAVIDTAEIARTKPPGAIAYFMFDPLGGSGWEMEDGSRYYTSLPDGVVAKWSMTLSDAPAVHLGQPIEDQSVQHLCTLFLAYIGRILAEAEAHFGGQVRPN